MQKIEREELKQKLDNGDNFKLVMAVTQKTTFERKHIPRSIHVPTVVQGVKLLAKEDEIVVYSCNEYCLDGKMACQMLTALGYKNLHYYTGGVDDWEEAGYPLEEGEKRHE